MKGYRGRRDYSGKNESNTFARQRSPPQPSDCAGAENGHGDGGDKSKLGDVPGVSIAKRVEDINAPHDVDQKEDSQSRRENQAREREGEKESKTSQVPVESIEWISRDAPILFE